MRDVGAVFQGRPMRLFVFARHGESSFNAWHRVNGDPHRVVPLTTRGERQARALGDQIRNLPIDLAVCTRFERTRRTAELALEGRPIPVHVEPSLDEIDVGRLDGQSIASYRAWKRRHDRNHRFPGGESLDAAMDRYVHAFRELLARPERVVLVVTHELPIRYALGAAAGISSPERSTVAIPNATAYLFDEASLKVAATRLEREVGSQWAAA
jgi:broad specificity phosphatase PhoE